MNDQITTIDIMEKVLDPKYWMYFSESKEHSKHCHRNSPYETSNSCANCDGARCYDCELITIPEHLELCMTSDKLCDIIINEGVPKDIARFFAYDDSCELHYKGYKLIWPSANMFKSKYPLVYEEYLKLKKDKKN